MENILLILSFLIGIGIGYLWGNASGKGYIGKTTKLSVKTASARKKR